MKKKRLFFLRATVILALGLVLLLDAAFVILPPRAFSPLENRNLQQRPALSLSSLVSGRFESRFDRYLGDQFPFRDLWVALKSALDRLAGRTESGGVFLGRDGALIQRFDAPAEADYRRTVQALSDFLNRHGELAQYVMIVPTAATVWRDKLPWLADAGDEDGYLNRLAEDLSETSARFIDLRGPFEQAGTGARLYFNTDHHWTIDGARLAYQALVGAAGLSGGGMSFERRLLSNRFQGTLTAASGFRMNQREDLWACLPGPDAPQLVVTNVGENTRSASLFRSDRLDTRDQYAVFLGGNDAELRVETTVDNGRTLLVLKDSYANCLIPFLAADYQKLVVVDPRYFTGDLEVLMDAEGVNEVLVLYNACTLAQDRYLAGDLERAGDQTAFLPTEPLSIARCCA